MIIALTSDVYDRGRAVRRGLDDHAAAAFADSGSGPGSVGGSSLPAVRVELNPTQLNSYGLGLQDVAAMLSAQNANLAQGPDHRTGRHDRRHSSTNDQLLKAEYYKPLIVGYHNGAAVKLSDVADVEDSVENIRAAAY